MKHTATITVTIDPTQDENKALVSLSSALWHAEGVNVTDVDITGYARFCSCGRQVRSDANGGFCAECVRGR